MALGFSAPIRADYNCLTLSVADRGWLRERGAFLTLVRRKDSGKRFHEEPSNVSFKVPRSYVFPPCLSSGFIFREKGWVHKTLIPPALICTGKGRHLALELWGK